MDLAAVSRRQLGDDQAACRRNAQAVSGSDRASRADEGALGARGAARYGASAGHSAQRHHFPARRQCCRDRGHRTDQAPRQCEAACPRVVREPRHADHRRRLLRPLRGLRPACLRDPWPVAHERGDHAADQAGPTGPRGSRPPGRATGGRATVGSRLRKRPVLVASTRPMQCHRSPTNGSTKARG